MEYKVITMKDGFFGGKFDPAKLETALNSYAQEGWALNATATADNHFYSGEKKVIDVKI
jgi:hypothetical protein